MIIICCRNARMTILNLQILTRSVNGLKNIRFFGMFIVTGTEFVVSLNFKTLDKATVYGPIPELVGARALVVDDDVHTCTSVSKMLREIEMRTLKNNKKANIPIIAMTANAFEEDKKKAFKAGMNAHIAKPIDIKTILAVFDQVFGTS